MAYINAEKTKTIRNAIKAAFPDWKISVRNLHHSEVCVTIQQAPIDLLEGRDGDRGYVQTNTYYLDRDFSGDALAALEQIKEIGNAGNHDNSDSQRDYFDVGWHFNLHIGAWDKPFVCTAVK